MHNEDSKRAHPDVDEGVMKDDCDSPSEWVIISTGARIRIPKLPPQQEEDVIKSNIPGGGGASEKGFQYLEKVRSAWGSTAGAGSDFFHVYRKQRAREMARQEELEKSWKEEEEMREFQQRRIANFKADEERARKRSEKRKRKKELAVLKRQKRNSQGSGTTTQQKEASMSDAATTPLKQARKEVVTKDESAQMLDNGEKSPKAGLGENSGQHTEDRSANADTISDKTLELASKETSPQKAHRSERVKLAVIDDGDESF